MDNPSQSKQHHSLGLLAEGFQAFVFLDVFHHRIECLLWRRSQHTRKTLNQLEWLEQLEQQWHRKEHQKRSGGNRSHKKQQQQQQQEEESE